MLRPPHQVIRAVIFIGTDEPELPHEPGIEVIDVPLGKVFPQASNFFTR